MYYSTLFLKCIFVGVQFMCKFDAGGNRGGGTIKSSIGSLWGDQHYGPEYNCGAGTAIYAPFQEQGSESEKYHLVFLFLKSCFFSAS